MEWNPSPQELHKCWRAFVELHAMGEVELDIREEQQSKAARNGWPLAEERILQRMLDESVNFHMAWTALDVDVVDTTTGFPMLPEDLPDMLAERKLAKRAS
jgi:hypothetical protein